MTTCYFSSAFTLLALSALVAYATAGPCLKICKGHCDISAGGLGAAFPIFAEFVPIAQGVCKGGCMATCGCVVRCNALCTPKLTMCRRRAQPTDVVGLAGCMYTYTNCQAQCGVSCTVSTLATVIRMATTPKVSPGAAPAAAARASG